MHLDVVELRAFYYRTKLGRATQRLLQQAILRLWPDVKGANVAGFGFAAPFLRPFLKDAARVQCLMPGEQGVMPWPPGEENHSVLVEEYHWPLESSTVDYLVVGHGLETCNYPDALLDEIWRVLTPGGKVIFIIPNRSGMWARSDATPFGYGRPYSLRQVEQQIQRHRFEIEHHHGALYAPPSNRPYWLRSARVWEKFGRMSGTRVSAGVMLVEASKRIYATPKSGLREAVRGGIEALEGLALPRPKPVPERSQTD